MSNLAIDYNVVATAARQLFDEKIKYIHPFFRSHSERVFNLYLDTHEILKDSADNQLPVMNDNFDLMKKTLNLCGALDSVRENLCHNGGFATWTKIESDLAFNGKLKAVISRHPCQRDAWLFSRYTDSCGVVETISFQIDRGNTKGETLKFLHGVPNDYARYVVVSGVECIGVQTPIMTCTRPCVFDITIKQSRGENAPN